MNAQFLVTGDRFTVTDSRRIDIYFGIYIHSLGSDVHGMPGVHF